MTTLIDWLWLSIYAAGAVIVLTIIGRNWLERIRQRQAAERRLRDSAANDNGRSLRRPKTS